MLIREYRIVMPMTLDEFKIGLLWSVTERSKRETGGGEGVEIVANEPYKSLVDPPRPPNGQYTSKIWHLASKVPSVLRMLAPKGSLEIAEKAWNGFPRTYTLLSNPEYMKDGFYIAIETSYVANDTGAQENIFNLSSDLLQKRVVEHIDIVNDPVSEADYSEDEDPSLYQSQTTGRGPITGADWQTTTQPIMCCYKLVTVEFKWWGLQGTFESRLIKAYRRIFANFHRQVFCWMDNYNGLTMSQIRQIEEKSKVELDQMRDSGSVKGMTEK